MKKVTKDKFGFTLLLFNIILFALSISYFSYSLFLLQKIETLLRIGIISLIIIIAVICVVLIIKCLFNKKKGKVILITIFTIILSAGISFIGYNINKIYNAIASVTTNVQTYSSSIVALSSSNFNSISDIGSEKIGILSDKESVDGYQIPHEIISENKLNNELVEYNNYLDLINGLLNGDINLVFLPTNYSILFGNIEGLADLSSKTKIVFTKDKNLKVQKTFNSKNLDDPFSILLMGVDSENEEIKGSSFNGDSLILITFNPKTLNTTMLSIPRDTYTSISCFAGQKKNKITHAAWYGESCMMKTIENMFDIDINYFIKINFKGVVKIVDALGGVDVDVPFSFCEQNSNREFGSYTVYVKEGFQTLNGEQALALARNRHPWKEYCSKEWTNYNSNDFIRGQNQQMVIQAMLNKLKNVSSIDTFYEMLNSISQSMETNMSTENILSFYNIAKDILIKNTSSNDDLSSLIGFQRLYLSGYDQTIVDYDSNSDSGSRLALYNFVPYQGSINDISKAMKVNLGIIKDEPVKSFDFDINDPYEEFVIGKGNYNEGGISLLPSFVGRSLSEVQSYCSSRGISLNVNKVETISSSYDKLVSAQSLPAGMDVAFISRSKGLTVDVYEYKKKTDDTDTTDKKTKKDDDKDNKKTSTKTEDDNSTSSSNNQDDDTNTSSGSNSSNGSSSSNNSNESGSSNEQDNTSSSSSNNSNNDDSSSTTTNP